MERSINLRKVSMRKLGLAAFAALMVLCDPAGAQGKPPTGAKIYDHPPRPFSLPAGTKGFYQRRPFAADCPSKIFWVRLGKANARDRVSTCIG
jgi:hypothetical protein